MESRHCSKCDMDRPETDWHPSQWLKGGWCKSCYRDWHRARYEPKRGDDEPRDCASCGSSYRPKNRRPSVYCSRQCKSNARHAALAAELLASKPADRKCVHCGGTLPQSMRVDAIFCSVRCNESAHAMQRKYRARTGDQTRMGWIRAEICERDRWRCGICKKKVDPNKSHPDPGSASLDHIVPVAENGSSQPSNLRLTHLRCNLSRRHRGGGEQLAII